MNVTRYSPESPKQQSKPVVGGGVKCTHHWHYESAISPTSKGTCQLCGKVIIGFNWPTVEELKQISNNSRKR